jgi:hypothetical protein
MRRWARRGLSQHLGKHLDDHQRSALLRMDDDRLIETLQIGSTAAKLPLDSEHFTPAFTPL